MAKPGEVAACTSGLLSASEKQGGGWGQCNRLLTNRTLAPLCVQVLVLACMYAHAHTYKLGQRGLDGINLENPGRLSGGEAQEAQSSLNRPPGEV